MELIFNTIGTLGVAFVLLAFFLLQKKVITDDNFFYNILNVVGGLFVGIYASYFKAWISVVLNLAWVVIAVYDLVANIYRKKENIREEQKM